MSDHPDNNLPSSAPNPRVRVAVIAVDDDHLRSTLGAIERQVYEIEGLAIIDFDGDITEPGEHEVLGNFAEFVTGLGPETDLVWIVHGDAQPRPDALGALVAEMERNDASLIGSKIIDAVSLDRLESVGSATDVFGEPYTGLDPGEVDLEQYDVVRDVAFISAVSMLARRDLVRGLRGIDPLLPPVAAGMDFSQRARVAGGRVMVAPSSEVLHSRTCRDEVAGWREWAGRMRSMLKAYRLITLVWVVSIGTVLGFIDGVVRLFLGTTRPLVDFFKALLWNISHLPGSLTARNLVRATRQVGDEELFRYQVTGSVRMRTLLTDIAERFGWVIDDEPGVVTEEELEDESTAAGPVVATLGLVVVGLATRSFWAGRLPQSGFTLPVMDPIVAMNSFAGGWNPAGLGSLEPVHPSAAFFAALEWMTGGWGFTFRAAIGALLVAAFFGAGRLLRELGVTGPTRHLAGVLAVIGVTSAAFATDADVAGWLAVGPTLWAVVLSVMPWPKATFGRIGRLGGLILWGATAGLLAPGASVVIFVVAAVIWLLVPAVRVGAAARGLLAADFGLLAAAPYLIAVTQTELTGKGPSYDLIPDFVPGLMLVLVVLFGVGFLPGHRHRVAAVGGVLLSAAAWLPFLTEPRGDLGAAVGILAVVGLVLVVGAAVGLERDGSAFVVVGRGVASFAAVVLVLFSLGHVLDGRVGFAQDQWGGRLEFTASLGSEIDAARVLVVGGADVLPGEHRTRDDVAYRLVPIGGPSLEGARLGSPRLGDEALSDVVAAIAGGELVRPGELLAEFGIGWVAVVDDASFAAAMSAQVDMDEVPVREDLTVFLNSVEAPRAVSSSGAVWSEDGADLVGAAGPGTVRIADNASPGWGPSWQQADWANQVSAAEGIASYKPDSLRRTLAWVTVGLFLAGVVCLPFTRRAER
jgi:hypothetical protein